MTSNTSPDGIQEDLDQNDEQPAYRDAAYMSDGVSSGKFFFPVTELSGKRQQKKMYACIHLQLIDAYVHVFYID